MTEEESLLAAIYEDVELHSYDTQWPEAFEVERDRLLSLFPGTFIDVQHIGSTAVPGLSAKPVIDILAGVQSIAVAEQLALPLCQSGYTTSAEFNESLPDRKWFMRWANGHRTHHLHIVVHGSPVWNERLEFRNALRSSPESRQSMPRSKSSSLRHTPKIGRHTPMPRLSSSAPSRARPNPSIEGTSTSGLRPLAAAPHVKR